MFNKFEGEQIAIFFLYNTAWRDGRYNGFMVSALNSGVSSLGWSPGQGHCVVLLSKTLNSHSASLPMSINGYQQIAGET